MKSLKILTSCALAFALLALPGCDKKDAPAGDQAEASEKKAPEKKAAPEKKVEKIVALTKDLDVGAAVKDPDVTSYQGMKMKGPADAVVKDTGMGMVVEWGKVQFEFRYEFEDEGAVAKGKKSASEDQLDKLVKFHVDTPRNVLWESKSELGGENNFSFVATTKVGDKTLVCKNKGYGQFTKAQAEALMRTCQSAKK